MGTSMVCADEYFVACPVSDIFFRVSNWEVPPRCPAIHCRRGFAGDQATADRSRVQRRLQVINIHVDVLCVAHVYSIIHLSPAARRESLSSRVKVHHLPRSRKYHAIPLFAHSSFTFMESTYSVTAVIFSAPFSSLVKLKSSRMSCPNVSPGKLRSTFIYGDEVGAPARRMSR